MRQRDPRRADARRNRERVLDAARELFAADGVEVPLDAIARRAEVGPGTLHRHFPTKQALLAAVVVTSLDRRVQEGERLIPDDAGSGLFELLDRFLKDGIANRALKAALAENGFDLPSAAPETAQRLHSVLDQLLTSAQRAGTARRDLDCDDVKAVLAGALAAQDRAGADQRRAKRLRALLLDGIRPRPS